ncbi:MAG TPA: hypothetical protein VFC87_04425 [Perlabentimonas sp.]|nr:hypothetical protein [Perlabentimonas sp.]
MKPKPQKQVQTLGGYKHSPSVLSTIDKTEHNTRDEIAKDLGWRGGERT